MRSRRSLTLALMGLGLVALAGCGTHGYAAALAKPVTRALVASGSSQPYASATFTPVHATRFVAYYKGQQVSSTDASNPVVIRQGSCQGPTLAAITDGATSDLGAATVSPAPATEPDSAGGVDVAVEPGSNLYVVVFDRPNDPAAQIVACGSPLSDRQQYFDLYEATRGSAGIALGTALMSPIVATQLDVSLASPAASAEQFVVRQGGCDGAPVATATAQSGSATARAVIFRSLDAQGWWITTAPKTGPALCAHVAG